MYTAIRASHSHLFRLTALVAAQLLVPLASRAQYYNTATGADALYFNTTGSYNVADGFAVLYYNTSGSWNTAGGFEALFSNTTGNNNTANGDVALFSNTTGSDNTANGVSALYLNTTGYNNTANGTDALYSNTTGDNNSANGAGALFLNTTGIDNTANGVVALYNNTTGNENTANGINALYSNTTGSYNTANGDNALYSNTTGSFNTADGSNALFSNTTGSSNIALGSGAGQNLTTGSNNIAIGNAAQASDNGVIRIGTSQKSTFIAGISGKTVSGGVAVYINSHGQLGTLTSSRRFKNDIKDMGAVTEKLMSLRPVTFRYKDSAEQGPHSLQYGLIAEEVAKVYPELVQYDKQGKPFTVYYHLLTPMLLNELQKEHRQAEAQTGEIADLKRSQQSEVAEQNTKIAALTAALQTQCAELASLKHAQQQGPSSVALVACLGLTGATLLRRRRSC